MSNTNKIKLNLAETIFLIIATICIIILTDTVVSNFPNKKEAITYDTMTVGNHEYIVFYNGSRLQHIEHSPSCDCYTIDYE